MLVNNSSCLQYLHRNQTATVRLFCFHYAGGNANLFNNWHSLLPKNLELIAIQLPGRINLSAMIPCTEMSSVINILYKAMLPVLLDKPFVFFGHSLGGLISFELARFIQSHHQIAPVKLISAACQSPRIPRGQKKISTLSEEGIIKALIAYNNTPRKVLENKELMQIALPIIRADFAVNESYSDLPGQPLTCPITVYGGIDDLTVNQAELENWRLETKGQFKLHLFSGDHFFIFKHKLAFLHQLSDELQSDLD